jgi:hypothetical protein
MPWAANSARRRAYRVVHYIRSRDTYVLRSAYGTEFEESPAQLAAAGYHIVKAKPRYAE